MSAISTPAAIDRARREIARERVRRERRRRELAHDPVAWSAERRGSYLWSKQREIKESVRDNRYTAVHAAHGLGKSWVAADVIAWWCDVHPIEQVRVVWTAPTYPQVNAIIGAELRLALRELGVVGLKLKGDNVLEYEGDFVGYGRKPADHDQAAFQGIHRRYVLVVIDEACGVPKALFDQADALVTNEDSRMLAIANPDDPESHFGAICDPGSREGRGWNVIHMDGLASPNFTGEEVPDELRAALLGETWVQERRARWGEDSAIYIAKVRGLFSRDGSQSMISYSIVQRARELEHGHDPAPGGPLGGVLSLDVARSENGDTNTLGSAYRGRVEVLDQWHSRDLEEIADRAEQELRAQAPNWKIVVDGDGIGGGVVDILRRRGCNVVEYRGSERARHKPARYGNRRAEAWAAARDQLREGLWKLPDDDGDERADDLAADLSAPRRTQDASGRTMLEPKRDVIRRLGRSPDLGDMAVMAIVTHPDVHSPGAIRPDRQRRRRSSPLDGAVIQNPKTVRW